MRQRRLDLALGAFALLLVAQLHWRLLPEVVSHALAAGFVLFYLWQSALAMRDEHTGERPPADPVSRWVAILAALLVIGYLAWRVVG